MLIFGESFFEIFWHADLAFGVHVIPFDLHSKEDDAFPIDRDFIPLSKHVNEIVDMLESSVFYSKIIDNEDKYIGLHLCFHRPGVNWCR